MIASESKIKTVTNEEAIQALTNPNNSAINSATTLSLVFDFEKITKEKLSNTRVLLTVVPVVTPTQQISRALVWKVDNVVETILYREYPSSVSTSTSFTGIIMMTRLNGEFIRAYKLKNNNYVVDLIPIKKAATSKSSNSLDEEAVALQEVIVVKKSRTSYTFVPMIDATKTVSDLEDYYWLKSGGGGATEPTAEEELKIDSEDLNGKAKCLNDLLTKEGDSFIKELLANFQGNSEFDIKIISAEKVISQETGLEVNGNTISPVNNIIVINISTSRTDQNSNLDAARVLLHEYIHADIFRKLYTKYPAINELDFKKTYEAYGSQHGAMGTLYITSMRDALKSFHKNKLTNDYNSYVNYYGETPSDAFYEALAWGGLKDSNVKAYEELSPLIKTEIENLAKRNAVLTRASPCPN